MSNVENSQKISDQLFTKYGIQPATTHEHTKFIADLPGFPQAEIYRAGVILITTTAASATKKAHVGPENFVVILGTDAESAALTQAESELSLSSSTSSAKKKRLPWNCWFSGQCEERDGTYMETVVREAFEESAGVLALTAEDVAVAVEEGKFFYNPLDKTFTVIIVSENFEQAKQEKAPSASSSSPAQPFNEALAKLSQSKTAVSSAMFEMGKYHAVPLTEFLKLVQRMKDQRTVEVADRNDPVYQLTSIDNKILRMDHFYAWCLSAGAESAIRLAVDGVVGLESDFD